jgi:hypothetical protein
VDGVLRITPADVRKIDTNVHPFWHAVTRPAVWLCNAIEVGFVYAVNAPLFLWALLTGQF